MISLRTIQTFACTGLLALAAADCSGTSTDPGGGAGNSGGSGGSGGSGSSGGQNSNGSGDSSGGSSTGGSTGASGSSSGSASGGASSGSGGSGSGSGASSGSAADGGSTPLRGCGQGTSCTPGTDLAPPATGQGFQIVTPANAIAVLPGQESFLCFYKTLPNTTEFDVGTMQSWMTPQSSHHFIAYRVTGGGGAGGTQQPDGTLVPCAFGGGTWMYATSVAGQIIELKMPDTVGLPLPAGTQIMLNMHFINPGTTTVYPQVKMNFIAAQNMQFKAAAMVSFNQDINVPPATAAGPGTQTVGGTCIAPVGSKFFDMSTHTHKHATLAEVNYISGGQTTNIVHTTDWEHPDVALWSAPNFLTVQPGDSFTYSCTYSNSGTTSVTVGETAASNEMCMAIGYYFPAGGASCQ